MSRHDPKLSGIRSRFPLRRKILLGIVVALLALVAWLHYTGAAATHGITTQDMDWNGELEHGGELGRHASGRRRRRRRRQRHGDAHGRDAG